MRPRYGKGRDNNSREKIDRKSFTRSKGVKEDHDENYVRSERFYGQEKTVRGRAGRTSLGYAEDYDEGQADSNGSNSSYYKKQNDQHYDTKEGRGHETDGRRSQKKTQRERNPDRETDSGGQKSKNHRSKTSKSRRNRSDLANRRFDR